MRRAPILLLGLLLSAAQARADEVLAAVAANFAAPIESLAQAFESETGHRLQVSLGASGALYAQIRHGAPFALMLSADSAIPERLVDEGFALPDTRFTYARGRLALWSAAPDRIDGSNAMLLSGRFERVAIADPRIAPYGRAAEQTLRALNITLRPEHTVLRGDSISRTYQFVASGNAEIGFVALSQVWRDGQLTGGSAWLVPSTLHAPLLQDAVLLEAGRNQPAARAFLDFMRGGTARAVMSRFGYETPPDA